MSNLKKAPACSSERFVTIPRKYGVTTHRTKMLCLHNLMTVMFSDTKVHISYIANAPNSATGYTEITLNRFKYVCMAYRHIKLQYQHRKV